jgi:GNAT superfamily N-acetyltransferase
MQHAIRPAREPDGPGLARLATQLGYPTSGDEIRRRLQRVLASPNDIVLVASTADGSLAGWAHGFVCQLLESDPRVEIGGLVVDERFRRQGIGRKLIRRIERWAGERGVAQVSVRCRTTRLVAHKFYGSLGYHAAKTQAVFRKRLLSRTAKIAN